jgi:hypothetical protein
MESILCIPRMESNTPKQYIFSTLCKLNWGQISIINEIPLRNEPTHKRILIKVKWDTSKSPDVIEYRTRITKGDSVKLVHNINSPWFWKIVLGKS